MEHYCSICGCVLLFSEDVCLRCRRNPAQVLRQLLEAKL
jgi:hypothetical protein